MISIINRRTLEGVIFLLLAMIPTLLSAQRAAFEPKVHQLEIRAAGAEWLAGHANFQSSIAAPVALTGANGLRYQYAYSLRDAFRLGVSYHPSTWTAAEIPDAGISAYEAQIRGLDLQLGYVRRYHTGPFQLYTGADLRGVRQTLAENGQRGGADWAQNYDVWSYGVQGVAGVRRFVTPFLSIALEANAGLLVHQASNGTSEPLSYEFYGDQSFSAGLSAFATVHFVKLKKRCTCPKGRK